VGEGRKKILITGAAGFIGRNLAEYLAKGYDVFAPSHDELDLSDHERVDSYFSERNFDVVVHAAAVGGSRKQHDVKGILATNIRMFLNLLKNEAHYDKLIFMGSGAEYGKQREIIKVKESEFGNVMPADEYGLSKFLCSRLFSKKCINLRLFGVFGRYEDYETRFISNMICRSIKKMPLEMNQNMFLDYVYVMDLCRIVERFIQKTPKNQYFNVGTGEHIDLKTIAELIVRLSRRESTLSIGKPGLNKEYTCDNSLLMSELGEFEFTKIEDAIKEMVDWYMQQDIDTGNLRTYR
jgi:UDP-glucose 4-epimerase